MALPVAPPGTVAPILPAPAGPMAPPSSRSLSTEAPPLPSAEAPPLAAFAVDPATAAIAAGIAHRDSDGSVLFAPPLAAPNQSAVQRTEVTEALPPGELASPSAAEAVPALPVPTPSASGSAAGPVAGANTTTNLDELARRLFDPLSARIKAELRLDRERAGLVTDLRR